jgi:demethylmenaquinone methyltransferase/2-methoxy-6-polyprenyl-1,4-benzoquinol methylase
VNTTPRYDPTAIRELFDEMAATYGMVNLIASFGFAARWRHQAVKQISAALRGNQQVVDLMSGMNELSHSISLYADCSLRVTAIDFSPEMLLRARTNFPFPVKTHLEDIFTWGFPPGAADIVLSSFGLKTFDRDQQALLAERIATLLCPGGTFSLVEISVPPARFLRLFYLFYLNHIVPWIGRLFLGNPTNYRMLGVYTREFGNCCYFAECLRQQGLHVTEVSYFFGCATGVTGSKPDIRHIA